MFRCELENVVQPDLFFIMLPSSLARYRLRCMYQKYLSYPNPKIPLSSLCFPFDECRHVAANAVLCV